eukprot:TRINITY_DN7506_c0_g1_i1.p1 TRINITY_DN7506_c0_g1~~TRINITY_DN7506_c0_g1_i1.p1  ORF type:complete len:189 (-),score=38.01 TRINITY_DN7506_c0_g1_i1:219-785(-)
MLVPKKNRLLIYSYLFKEGTIVCKKDMFLPKHPQLAVPNLQVMKLMQSLCSRNFVKELYNWQHFYYTLTNKGIDYLRDYLHLPADTVPTTLKKPEKPQPAPSFVLKTKFGAAERRGRDREEYRKGKSFGEAPEGFNPDFNGRRSGFRGRGRGRGGFRGGRGRRDETSQQENTQTTTETTQQQTATATA